MAVAGFPVAGANEAPAGSPAALIETLTTGAPGAVAASENTRSRPTFPLKRFPSAGVGADHVTDGVAVSRAETEAGSARQTSAAAMSMRCRPPVKRRRG